MLAHDLEQAVWIKSSHSGQGGDCVETATLAGNRQAVRDSKDKNGPALIFSAEAWSSFVVHVKSDSFSGA